MRRTGAAALDARRNPIADAAIKLHFAGDSRNGWLLPGGPVAVDDLLATCYG
jgi:hypothetical protein